MATYAENLKHVSSDLRPYLCTVSKRPEADMTYVSHSELPKHEMNVHYWPAAYKENNCWKQPIGFSHDFCLFCQQSLETEFDPFRKGGWKGHVGRHMEEIAIAFNVVPKQYKEWGFYSKQSPDSIHKEI